MAAVEAGTVIRPDASTPEVVRWTGPVTVGASLWSASRHDSTEESVGGVVVDVSETLDLDTGELVRLFLTVDPHRGRVVLHRLADTDLGEPSETPEHRLVRVVRLLAAEIAAPLTKGKGDALTHDEAERVRWMAEVTTVAMKGRR